MFVLSHQFPMESARADSQHSDAGLGDDGHGKKVRFDFERFSSMPREMFSFFSRLSD